MKKTEKPRDHRKTIQTAVCLSPESPGFGQNLKENPEAACNPPYMHEVQRVWNEERGEWVIELTGFSMCTDCLQYDCFKWEGQEPDPNPLYFKTSDEAIKWQRKQGKYGYSKNEISDEGIFNEMNENGWIDETPNGWRIVTDEEIEAGYWNSNKGAAVLFDMKAQGFPDGPDWERYDYKTGGDGLEMPTEYWTNKKTGISYEVEAEAVIEHYAAEVYHSPDPYISTSPEMCKSINKKEKRTF